MYATSRPPTSRPRARRRAEGSGKSTTPCGADAADQRDRPCEVRRTRRPYSPRDPAGSCRPPGRSRPRRHRGACRIRGFPTPRRDCCAPENSRRRARPRCPRTPRSACRARRATRPSPPARPASPPCAGKRRFRRRSQQRSSPSRTRASDAGRSRPRECRGFRRRCSARAAGRGPTGPGASSRLRPIRAGTRRVLPDRRAARRTHLRRATAHSGTFPGTRAR